ncbi:MAG: glucose-6-phosphate dehydrogenase [Trueperaceae bacterium]
MPASVMDRPVPQAASRGVAPDEAAPRTAFVIFGVTGDLSSRKLLPALYALHRGGHLHEATSIIGFGRSDWDDDGLRAHAAEAIREHGDSFEESCWRELASRLHYIRGDYGDGQAMQRLARLLDQLEQPNRVFYTATPPTTYPVLVEALADAGLSSGSEGWTRLVIEKPFGRDLASATRLNELLLQRFEERQIYRIDHYLAKETAQNLAVLRFANTLFEPVWSNRYIDHVQLTMTESVGVEGRGGFYEESGVVRDVFQNHLLQLLALVAMEPPARYDATSVRNEKVKLFDAMGCAAPEDTVLGQYVEAPGTRGYRQEEDVDPASRQATYAAARFEIHNWRWSGVPFLVRSGKRLEGKATEIVLRFKTPPHVPFTLPEELRADRLTLRLTPDEGIAVRFNTKVPGQGIELERANMEFTYASRFARPNPDAYETLLLDTMLGDATLFMRADEVEAQWRVVAPILRCQDDDFGGPFPYQAGTLGPPQADRLPAAIDRRWYRPGNSV